MTMELVHFLDWVVRVDAARTRALYTEMPVEVDAAHCESCRNLATLIDAERAFAPALRLFLDQCGIDPRKTIDSFEVYDTPTGRYYNGYFHVIGEIVSGADAYTPLKDGNGFSVDLRPCGTNFGAGITRQISFNWYPLHAERPLLQIDWGAELPWVLEPAADDPAPEA